MSAEHGALLLDGGFKTAWKSFLQVRLILYFFTLMTRIRANLFLSSQYPGWIKFASALACVACWICDRVPFALFMANSRETEPRSRKEIGRSRVSALIPSATQATLASYVFSRAVAASSISRASRRLHVFLLLLPPVTWLPAFERVLISLLRYWVICGRSE